MASYQIPTRRDLYQYSIQVVLDGDAYVLKFRYNRRSDIWMLSIGDAAINLPILGGFNILEAINYKITEIPQGVMQTLDLDGLNRDPNLDNFGSRVILTYTEAI